MERVKPFLEKYNDEFGVDSTNWYKVENKYKNIYVKSEIDSSENINMFEIIYNKSNFTLVFNQKKSKTNLTYNIKPIKVNPYVLLQKYNSLKSDFIIDHEPEKIPKMYNNNPDIDPENNIFDEN